MSEEDEIAALRSRLRSLQREAFRVWDTRVLNANVRQQAELLQRLREIGVDPWGCARLAQG